MAVYHDEIEIEDFEYDEEEDLYTYPCVSNPRLNSFDGTAENIFQPCGDEFIITKDELIEGLEEATCPSCSLVVKVIYNKVRLE